MVNALVFLLVVVLGSAAVAAAVARPLRGTSPRLFAAIVAAVPLAAAGLYGLVGTPAALDRRAAHVQDGPATMEEAIARLREELERDPARADGWILLARAYAQQGDHAGARDSFARALELMPDEPGLLVEAATARARATPGNRFDDEAVAMLRRAAALDPSNQHAPWFLGIAYRQRGEDAEAVEVWEGLLPGLDEKTAAALRLQIDEARAAAGMPSLPAPEPAPAAGPAGLKVRVSLDPGFASRVRLRGDATVFVIARAPDGPPMPVAVERHRLDALPLETVLDDADGPMPTARLSTLREAEVVARLSASGSATRAEGDVESAPFRVALPHDGTVELVIGREPR